MFLWQKLDYKYQDIISNEDFNNFVEQFNQDKPSLITFDTETTGLDFMKDVPFLFIITWNKKSFTFELDLYNENSLGRLDEIYNLMKGVNYSFAHNTKYDFNMMTNFGKVIPDGVYLADGLTVARLTSYADEIDNIGLETIGTKYVDPNAKFAGKVIREEINNLNRVRLKEVKNLLKEKLPKNIKLNDVFDAWKKRTQFVENEEYDTYFKIIDENYKEPNYYDVYKKDPKLMKYYAVDDTVILYEYLKLSLPVLFEKQDPEQKVFKQECELIRVVADMERHGLRADINYLLESRLKTKKYIDEVYSKLWALTGKEFSSGQHKVIMGLMQEKYNIEMTNCDMQALQEIVDNSEIEEAKQVASYIIKLRTLDKWLSTYIEGMLNRVNNGRIYTSINNSGAITGRVSSDLQQQPQNGLFDDKGNELFHPRKVIINDDDYTTYYFDFSQMELRLQANYTVEISGGDTNLCRAFIPFKSKSVISGEEYKIGDDNWNSGEWIDENDDEWQPTDLHTVTTLIAFPEITIDDPHFKSYRKLGKMCNFLKNYGGGVEAIKSQLGVNDEIANKLNNAYYTAFPKILDYQKWIEDSLTKYGYIENIYGRRYYIQNQRMFYKGYNYVIQGGCADIVKDKEIQVYNFFKNLGVKSKMLLPVHDEIMVAVHKDEEWLVPMIKDIIDDNKEKVKYIPMLCDVEKTDTNWAEKYEVI
jgi:DNA polymerase-1